MAETEELPTVQMMRPKGKPFEATIIEHAVTVRLKGEADLAGIKDLQVHLRFLTSSCPVRLVLDFTEVTHIASSALKALAAVKQALVRAGGQLKIVGLKTRLFETIHMVGLADFFGLKKEAEETVWD